jgi:hypothetical protein
MAEVFPVAVFWLCKSEDLWPEQRDLVIRSGFSQGMEVPEEFSDWNELNSCGKEEVVKAKYPFFETTISPRWVVKEIQERRMLLDKTSVLKVLFNPIGIREDSFDAMRLR